MKDITKIVIALILALSVNLAVVGVIVSHQGGGARLGDIGSPIYTGIPTNTGVLCGTASTALVSTSTSRRYIEVRNQSNQTIWLSFGVPAATSTGVALVASSSPFVSSSNTLLYTGAINCIAVSNASTTVLEAK